MKKIITVIGARPQIIKAAAISRAIREHFAHQLQELIVHTGQHYDQNMSDIFFQEMGIPSPDYNLAVGSGNHGAQTAKMIEGLEQIILKEQPNAVLLYGDTNSTLAGAVAAAKLHIPVVHVEAGLRSYNKSMPEEINRIMCDHASTLLFSPTQQGIDNLAKEGFDIHRKGPYSADKPGVFHCGDIMYDNSLYYAQHQGENDAFLHQLGVEKNKYILVTVHRDHNTDVPERLSAIVRALVDIADQSGQKIILPLHPRTRKKLAEIDAGKWDEQLRNNAAIQIIDPASFLEMIGLESNCSFIITDSGGVQKEAFFFQKPCVILRPQTEWVEIVANGNAQLADADYERIRSAYAALSAKKDFTWPALFGDGKAAQFICAQIDQYIA
ncbi:MAG: hypothetical protein RLZZ77_696 [Bacteroidota bacterium]|jgi:UDP-GlcNAc3NAcA epimerase